MGAKHKKRQKEKWPRKKRVISKGGKVAHSSKAQSSVLLGIRKTTRKWEETGEKGPPEDIKE